MVTPFWPYAVWFGITVAMEDVDYLVKVIKQDRCTLYRDSFLVNTKAHNEYSKLQRCYAQINQIVFYDKFYNDEKCPKGTKMVLFVYLGFLRNNMNEAFPHLLNDRYKSVKL
jgi:hypothetical protein